MCLSIPHKIIKINGQKATVECGKNEHELDTRLVKNLKVGDYIMNENEFAIYKVSKKDALETLELINNAQKEN